MGNSVFDFKQFRIQQDACAMKVGTDGVLLGAWVGVNDVESALDIGTGTALIALMLAQRGVKHIDAVEIDHAAAMQAQENVSASRFFDKVHVCATSFQDYMEGNLKKYDLIVSNPPFFKEDFLSDKKEKNQARHTVSLNYDVICSLASGALSINGRLALVFPYDLKDEVVDVASKSGFFPLRLTNVLPNPTKQPKRLLIEFAKYKQEIVVNDLFIEMQGRHRYSDEYIQLTKDFYLYIDKN